MHTSLWLTNAILVSNDIINYNYTTRLFSVWEGPRHGDYGSFRFQMSHKNVWGRLCLYGDMSHC